MNVFDKAKAAEPAPKPAAAEMDTSNPEYQKALEMAKSKLYEEGAGQELGKMLASAPDLPKAMADQARMILNGIDDLTNGSVPDELFMVLGIELLGEVSDIAKSAGAPVDGGVIASAMKQFILSVMNDLGADTTQIQQAMDQVDPREAGAAMEQAGLGV